MCFEAYLIEKSDKLFDMRRYKSLESHNRKEKTMAILLISLYIFLTAFVYIVDKKKIVSSFMILGLIAMIAAGPLYASGII